MTTTRSIEDREKASIKTPMVARQGNDILVVTDLDKVLYDDAVDRATPHIPRHLQTLSSLSPIEIWPVTVVSQ